MDTAAALPDFIPTFAPDLPDAPEAPEASNEPAALAAPPSTRREPLASTTSKSPVRDTSAVAAAAPELGMFDLILRGQAHLTSVLRREEDLPATMQKLLVLALLGLGVHGLVVGFAAEALGETLFAGAHGHPTLWMPIAFVLAFVGALCVCLPSFYFYTQLAGLDASFRLVTAQALRAQATTAVLLLGVTPFYAAVVLAGALGLIQSSGQVILVGLAIPFVVGLFGMRALYKGFCDLAQVLPITHQRRGDFLRRMVLCWAVVYTAVAPVALYRIAELLSQHI
jgi:hypothetical protein